MANTIAHFAEHATFTTSRFLSARNGYPLHVDCAAVHEGMLILRRREFRADFIVCRRAQFEFNEGMRLTDRRTGIIHWLIRLKLRQPML